MKLSHDEIEKFATMVEHVGQTHAGGDCGDDCQMAESSYSDWQRCAAAIRALAQQAQPECDNCNGNGSIFATCATCGRTADPGPQTESLTDENDFGAAEWERIYKAPATNDGYREASAAYAARYPSAPSRTAFSAGMTAGSNLRRILLMRGARDRMAQPAVTRDLDDETVIRVARAIAGDLYGTWPKSFQDDARRAIAAMQQEPQTRI